MAGMGRYILDGKIPIPCDDLLQWAAWYETVDRHGALTDVPPFRVSTIFLGLDYGWNTPYPILFETMVFLIDDRHSGRDHYCERYPTWELAAEGHRRIVESLQAGTLELYGMEYDA